MLALIDKKTPPAMKHNLKQICDIVEFETKNIVYEAISGHPDIFFCKLKNTLICANNTPKKYLTLFKQKNISFISGTNALKSKYPTTALYNAVINGDTLIHKIAATDAKIKENTLHHIDVKQGYTRCNLVFLNQNTFFTSDQNIYTTLKNYKDRDIRFSGIYINPKQVRLPSFPHGFIGGTCGVFDKTIVFAGSLKFLKDGKILKDFITSAGYTIKELEDAPLFDCGSILFI